MISGKERPKDLISVSLIAIAAILMALDPALKIHAQSREIAVFTTAQAAKGRSSYANNCAPCHGENLEGGSAPTLKDAGFSKKWFGMPADVLFNYISTKMPSPNPGSLDNQTNAQVLAYLFEVNGFLPGDQELPSDARTLASMTVPRSSVETAPLFTSGGLSPFAPPPPVVKVPNPLARITSVTDALLQNPPDGDWLMWRRTYDDYGFSPLKQIDKGNVGDLRVAWTWSMPNGPSENTPLVHDGVIFVNGYGDNVQALDAATGDLLWQFSHKLPSGVNPSPKRNLAIYGDKLLVSTSDVHVVALDVKTGAVLWEREIGDYKKLVTMSAGPMVVKGKVIQGTVGRTPGGNHIAALDVETGEELWRFNTIAQPGDPGGESWNDLPLEKRNGASVWTTGSYDPALNLVYFGPGQTYDTGPVLHPVNRPGITNDGLFTDATVALNPDTGKMAWYYQHVPNDQWDLDWAFERQLIDLPINGVNRRVVVTAGKEAIYDALDAKTGQYIFSIDLGIQNVVTAIDPKTGAKTINPDVLLGDGKVHMVCPHPGGGRSWIPSSYNPGTKILYIPAVEACADMVPMAVGLREPYTLSAGVHWTLRTRPDTDGKYGRVEAINLETRKVAWINRQRAPVTTGALSTAGGIVFNGSIDRMMRAYDDSNGKELWQMRLNDVPSSAPISYSVNGKQYVAVVVGHGGAQVGNWPLLVPEIPIPPNPGSAIWVFELPDKDLAKTKQLSTH